jgi:VWFA-related protein
MNATSCLCGAAILIASMSTPARAQTASAQLPPTVVKTNVDEVVLDVVVRDKKGKPVNDLTESQVSVSDNGVKQTLTSFRLVQGSEAISATGAKMPLDPLRQVRLVTLAFEPLGEADQRLRARNAALDLIKGQQGTNVYYSVVVINTRLLVLQQFTKDQAALSTAIEKATTGTQLAKFISESDAIKAELTRSLQEQQGANATDPTLAVSNATQALGQNTTNGPPPDPTASVVMRVMLDVLRMDQAASSDSSRASLSALKVLVQGLQEMPGRKSVLYFSAGLYFTSELDNIFKNLKSLANRANVSFYSVDTRGVLTTSQNAAAMDQLRGAAKASATSVDRTGGAVTKDEMRASENAENSSRANVQIPIRDLAESTGGFLIGESNDLRGPLRQVNEEISSYYELSYVPGIQNYDGTFRKVSVTANGRRDLVIHSRNGYFALAPEVRAAGLETFEMPLLKAISDGVNAKDVEFHAGVVRLRPKGQGTDVSLLLEVPLRGLQPKPDAGKNSVHFSLAVVIKNAKGEVVDKVTRDRSLQVTAEQLKGGHFLEKATVTIPPGSYSIESIVLDRESQKMGTHHGAFDITAHTKGVAISSLVAVRSFTPGAAKSLDDAEPFQFQGGTITPTLNNTVAKADNASIRLFFTVYADTAISAKPTADLELMQGPKVLTKLDMPLPEADIEGRIPYVITIPSNPIPAGTYTLHATVKQGDSSADSRVALKVESADGTASAPNTAQAGPK